MGEWVVVVGRRSEIHHVYTSYISIFTLFQMPSRDRGFVRDLFLVCTLSDS